MADNRAAWVAALRSGKYRQGKYALHIANGTEETYCCLGVACELAKDAGVELEERLPQVPNPRGVSSYNNESEVLPDIVMQWLGMSCNDGTFTMESEEWKEYLADTIDPNINAIRGASVHRSLVALNDNGATFNQIADLIESMPDNMFVSE